MNFSALRLFVVDIASKKMLATKLNNRSTLMIISRLAGSFEGASLVETSSSAIQDRRFKRTRLTASIAAENLKEIAVTTKVLAASEWQSLKVRAVSEWSISEKSFESQMMVACCSSGNYSLGRSLMKSVGRDGGHVNVVILAKYLRLCADSHDECDENDILGVYAELSERHSMFDVMTVADIVHGLCRTSRWKDSLAHVDTIRLTCSSVPVTILGDLAMAAFRNGELDRGWEFLHQVDADTIAKMSDDVLLTWIRLPSTDYAMMERLFAYLRDRDALVSDAVAGEIKSWFQRRTNEEWRASISRVDDDGICLACGVKLEDIRLSEADFEDLRSNFMMRVIRGDDVYLKTNPHELEKFKRFVSLTSPYSIVVDGLNIAFSRSRKDASNARLAEQLLKTVCQLDRGHRRPNTRKMLILGRHHMGKWPRATMNQIEEMAHVFFIDDLSKDDPFMLYAAMRSGQGTFFVSGDLMRDHMFSLNDARLKVLFRRWQAAHQLHFLSGKSQNPLKFKAPASYRVAVQGFTSASGVGWHVPYDDGSTGLSHESTNAWLCVGQAPSTSKVLRRNPLPFDRLGTKPAK